MTPLSRGWAVVLCAALAPFAGCGADGNASAPTPKTVFLDQAWSADDRTGFYWRSQGSALISYDVYLALESATSARLLNSAEEAKSVGLLPGESAEAGNPDALPVGVTRTVVAKGPYAGSYMGLTCAACHTGELRRAETTIRIDGAKSNTFDVFAWLKGLDAALAATLASPERYQAFVERVQSRGSVDEADLKARLEGDAKRLRKLLDEAFIVPALPGAGRMDAIGAIQNTFLAMAPAIAENQRVGIAPVKVPFLWNTPQSAWVQWSGVSNDAFRRNFNECLGVFARYDLSAATAADQRYESTVDPRGIVALEQLVRRLAPPKWPEEVLGAIDPTRAAQGATLFAENCARCHTVYPYRWSEPRQQGKRFIANGLVEQAVVGADGTQFELMTFDSAEVVATQHLAPEFQGRAKVTAGEFFYVLVGKMMDKSFAADGAFTAADLLDASGYLGSDPESLSSAPVRSYKAPPLDGIWSAAPYLHNASVPNVFELLSPLADRSKTFYVGSEYDPEKLGFDTSGATGGRFHDTRVKGDANTGHVFDDAGGTGVIGRSLSVAERYALIEYLKTLPDQAGRVTPYGGPANPKLAKDDPNYYNAGAK